MHAKLSQLLRAMSQVADLGEAKSLGHGQRVAMLADTVADALGETDLGRRAELLVAALLHDIGIPAVSYSLFLQVGAGDRDLLQRFPSLDDGLFGADDTALEALRGHVMRHTDHGVRMLQTLGYGQGALDAVSGHHISADDGASRLAQILRLADLVDSATQGMGTVAERRAGADHVMEQVRGAGLESDIVDAAFDALDAEAWERLYFLDGVETLLDDAFERTYGVDVPFDGLEAHLRTLAQFVDAQSPYTAGHTFEVTRLAGRIGERIGIEPDGLNRLHIASLLHGAGRIGISSAILEKPGGLSEDEFMRLHTYPNLTREALGPLADLGELVDAASTHREKLDGSGYPEGRRGDEIPLVGRILGVADTFIALVSERPYRPAYSHSRALAIVQAESARLFDGLVADALEAVYREGL